LIGRELPARTALEVPATCETYLLQIAIPNIYFHLAMAYAVLRHKGVDIGKMDFLGPIHWVDA